MKTKTETAVQRFGFFVMVRLNEFGLNGFIVLFGLSFNFFCRLGFKQFEFDTLEPLPIVSKQYKLVGMALTRTIGTHNKLG